MGKEKLGFRDACILVVFRIPVAKITKDSENILATDQLNRITACDD